MRGEASPIGTERTTQNGYVSVKTESGWRFKHHVIMEKKLGRPLEVDERVYFKDGNKKNLKPSNLEVRIAGKTSHSRKSAQREVTILRKRLENTMQRIEELEARLEMDPVE